MCQTNLFVCERVKPKLSMVAPHPTVTDPSKGQLLHSSIWDIRYLPFFIRFGLKYLAHVRCEYQISNIQYLAHVRCKYPIFCSREVHKCVIDKKPPTAGASLEQLLDLKILEILQVQTSSLASPPTSLWSLSLQTLEDNITESDNFPPPGSQRNSDNLIISHLLYLSEIISQIISQRYYHKIW